MAMDDPTTRPKIRLLPGRHKRAAAGRPWIYSNEVAMDPAAKALPPGCLVTVETAEGRPLGTATFNPRPLISARLLDRDWTRPIDHDWLAARIERALAIRDRLYGEPYYRLIHAEADALPGLVIDRFGDVLACQLNTAGMDRLEPDLLAALGAVLTPEAVVFRNDSAARALEGLALEVRVAKGAVSEPVELLENGTPFVADLLGGQKTGWFYDQRENRAFVARLAQGARVLDIYAFGGGFGLQALAAGAREAILVDRSEAALALAGEAAQRNGLAARCRFVRGEGFAEMERLAGAGERFDIVVADPPAFIKTRKDVPTGLRGYRKMTRLAAALVAPGGFLFVASCSYNAEPAAFAEAVRRGLVDAGRTGCILRNAGAGADHPVHPSLPETAYLKALVLALT
jgi:23S rRNA (cytosine1962-C5)-methyltransferase